MIVKFQKEFLKELNAKYEYNGYTQILVGNRFYTATILIDSTPFIVCIPLHSNCRVNFISIEAPSSSSRWKNHGLDYGKLLLLKSYDLEKYASIDAVKNNVWEDIMLKKDAITSSVKQYFKDIINLLEKREKQLLLSKQEKNNLNHSTLNCFPEYINELREYNIDELEFTFKTFKKIDELVNSIK
jgi:hypothetical protein